MKRLFIFFSVLALFLLQSCNSNSPQNTLNNFFDAMAKKDITKARKYCTEASKDMLDMMERQAQNENTSIDTAKYDRNKVNFAEPVIEGDKATIKVTEKENQHFMNYYLKKEKDQWKVAFDKETIIGMGMESLVGMNNTEVKDSVSEKIDTTVQVSIDSLKQGVKAELKKLDSVRRLLKNPH